MYLKLHRLYFRSDYIIGRLYINDVYFCDTLESSHFAISPGDFNIKVVESPRFQTPLPRLIDVPHRSGILIHAGNTFKDTKGCILVGDNIKVGYVLNSSLRLNELLRILRKNQDIYCIRIF